MGIIADMMRANDESGYTAIQLVNYLRISYLQKNFHTIHITDIY